MLFNKINYTANISYLTNALIYEYDISKANINILYTYNIINKETYDRLCNAPRMVRQKYVGYMQKDIKIVNILQKGIIESKKQLFESNNIQDYEVLSIKNDAVYMVNRTLDITKFGLIEFKQKNVYTGFYRIDNLELYYYFNNIYKQEILDIKGIRDEYLKLHEPYFLQFLKDVFNTIQTRNIWHALRIVKAFSAKYIQRQLDVGFYRQFNSDSTFHITLNNSGFSIKNIEPVYMNSIDISTNLHILSELQKILYQIYFNKNS